MAGETQLETLLANLEPVLGNVEFVFCTMPADIDYSALAPKACIHEQEGLSLILRKDVALDNNILFDQTFRMITLTVHSSLAAVGLTAVVATRLAEAGISANVVAGFHHDHLFVPEAEAQAAQDILEDLTSEYG